MGNSLHIPAECSASQKPTHKFLKESGEGRILGKAHSEHWDYRLSWNRSLVYKKSLRKETLNKASGFTHNWLFYFIF